MEILDKNSTFVIKIGTTMGFEEFGIEVVLQSQEITSLSTAEDGAGFVLLCHTGTAQFEHFGTEHTLTSRDIVVAMPGDIYSLGRMSVDFTASWVRFSARAITKVAQSIPTTLIKYLAEHPVYNLLENSDYENRFGYLKLIFSTLSAEQNPYAKEIVRALLRSLLLETHNGAVKSFQRDSYGPKFRNDILNRFVAMVTANPQCREVAHFAQRLSISPKHLSAIVGSGTGMTAKEFIDNKAVEQIKHLLLTTTLTAQQIAQKLNFSGTGNLSRFFKTNTGMTLSDYRHNSHNKLL